MAAMVGVAQLAERQVVVLDVVGSNPIAHPKKRMIVQVADQRKLEVDHWAMDPARKRLPSGEGSRAIWPPG